MNRSHRPVTTPRETRQRRHSGDAGFTIIEVLVAALLLALVAAGGAVAFVSAVGTSGIQRSRSAAEALAQQNESRLRGYTVSQLSNLNQTVSPAPVIDNTTYTVHESAAFVSDSSGSPSCTNPSADYLETSSTVTWSGMPTSLNGVTVTGLLTPTAGQISSSAGVLAVEVQNPSGTAIAGLPVSATETGGGSGSASGVTASNGCVLFADLPVGTYQVNVTPASGSYVDAGSGQAVNSGSPDTQTVTVSAGTTAASPTPFVLATPGAAQFSFTTAWPTGVLPTPAPTATSPSVVLVSGALQIVCSAQDTSGCPAVGHADTTWAASAWGGSGGQVTATPLVPSTYATYAGICTSDDPSLAANGGTADATTTVTAGNTTSTTLSLPAIVIRLHSGAVGSTEIALPSGSELVVTDTGCDGGEHYVGGPSVTVPSGASYLPINQSPNLTGLTNDTGLLAFAGMPSGAYTVCYQKGAQDTTLTFTNKTTGEVENLYTSSLATGTCST